MAQFKQSSSRSISSRKRLKTTSPQVREQALAASERLIKLITVLEHHIDKLSQAVNTGKKHHFVSLRLWQRPYSVFIRIWISTQPF